ncbi:PREDICTED: putative FBD-associated F-box protein At5g56440 [Brassica oleracea var. oleracea]|uniref:FBD domain-containing protein n=1 Tax=Brassica oleracea var. oleracea TaxID=109376 RepID=A0A0D3B361_BRAOL|nr:PREDICTED: putative FBD-associated F-box protein At5g56440 [Brassica oleracea var. oleracea]
MDRISPLPDDLILKILSFPRTEVAITTSLLSKRWRDVWKHVPKLEYYAPRASPFVHNFLLLHKAPVLQTMHVRLSQNHRPTDIEIWFRVAVERGVRKLRFHNYLFGPEEAIRLPGSLYTCQTLVSLTLFSAVIVDVPLTICFPSLKALRLRHVEFSNDEIVPRILSGCPVLEDLAITRVNNGNMKTFTIMIPSLLRLAVWDLKSGSQVPGDDIGLVITAPSLTSLTVVSQVSCSLVNMPSLVKANIKLSSPGDSKKLLQFLTSAKHLSLCAIPSTFSYPIGVFYHLVSLVLCTCCSVWFCLILRQTPKLRVLRFQPIERCFDYVQIQWEQTSSVPQCLISSLKTVEWIDYQGRDSEKKVVMYLLENSGQLKKMAIKALPSTNLEKRYKILQELSSTQRSSKKCQFSFT